MRHGGTTLLLLAAPLLLLTDTVLAQTGYLVNDTSATLYVRQAAEERVELIPEAAYRQIPGGGVLPFDPSLPVGAFAFDRGELQFRTLDTHHGQRATVDQGPTGTSPTPIWEQIESSRPRQ